ncbi:MAG: hydrogenase subunit MbhD domain-containing protein [Longicatena sp.]|nr:hydrogenase subunit MbhD domain-containing protein [Longicatena sp.]
MTNIIMYVLLIFLIICALAVSFSKNLLNSILIYTSYSLISSVIWVLLQSPDLAITEAAVGAGITSLLFFATLKKIHAIVKEDKKEEEFDHE